MGWRLGVILSALVVMVVEVCPPALAQVAPTSPVASPSPDGERRGADESDERPYPPGTEPTAKPAPPELTPTPTSALPEPTPTPAAPRESAPAVAPRAGPRPEPSREPADEPAEESLEDRRDESPEPLREDGDGALPEAATPLEADPPAPAPALPAPAPSAAPPVVGEDDWSPARPRTPIAVGLGELSPEEQFRELQLGLRLCLAELPRLERRVLALRAGLGVPTPWSRRRVARTLGLSPERVGNLERRGLRRLERLVGRDGCTSDERSTGADTTVAGGSGATGGRGETDQATLAVPAPRRADRTRLDDPVPGARRPHRGAARPDPARPESAVGAGIADRGSALDVPAVLAGLALVLAGVALARRALHRRRPLANAPGSPRVPRQAAEPGPLWASLDKRATDGAPRAYVGRRPRS